MLVLLGVLSGCATVSQGSPVEVRYQEGVAEGFVTVSSLDGKKLGEGEVTQVAAGIDRVASRLSLRFKDGSMHDERVVFSQKGQFKLVSYKLGFTQWVPHLNDRLQRGECEDLSATAPAH